MSRKCSEEYVVPSQLIVAIRWLVFILKHLCKTNKLT